MGKQPLFVGNFFIKVPLLKVCVLSLRPNYEVQVLVTFFLLVVEIAKLLEVLLRFLWLPSYFRNDELWREYDLIILLIFLGFCTKMVNAEPYYWGYLSVGQSVIKQYLINIDSLALRPWFCWQIFFCMFFSSLPPIKFV